MKKRHVRGGTVAAHFQPLVPAAHESPHTTKLYDRTQNQIALDKGARGQKAKS